VGALGLGLPPKRITIDLVPADLAKEGGHFDLPIAPLHHLMIARSLYVEKRGCCSRSGPS
jgi:predicted ATPase with chaperone activity